MINYNNITRKYITVEGIPTYARTPDWLFYLDKEDGLTYKGKAVYTSLMHYASKDGTAYPSQENIGKKVGLTLGVAKQGLTELQKLGILKVTRRKLKNGSNLTNHYTLQFFPPKHIADIVDRKIRKEQEDREEKYEPIILENDAIMIENNIENDEKVPQSGLNSDSHNMTMAQSYSEGGDSHNMTTNNTHYNKSNFNKSNFKKETKEQRQLRYQYEKQKRLEENTAKMLVDMAKMEMNKERDKEKDDNIPF